MKSLIDADHTAFKNQYSGKIVDNIDASKFNVNQSDGKGINFAGYSVVVNNVLNKDTVDLSDMTI